MSSYPGDEPDPKVIGIYGLSGCGKTTLTQTLKAELNENLFMFYEGSEAILKVFPGNLQEFRALKSNEEKQALRAQAITNIAHESAYSGKSAIVTGHYMFRSANDGAKDVVWTDKGGDATVYTHIIYLDTDPAKIKERRDNDKTRERPDISKAHLAEWQDGEKKALREICYTKGIQFINVRASTTLKERIKSLANHFHRQSETINTRDAISKVDSIMTEMQKQPQTMLVLDGDKTLTALDSGERFWDKEHTCKMELGQDPLKMLFDSQNDDKRYTFSSFNQAQLLYEEVIDARDSEEVDDNADFKVVCKGTAALIGKNLYAEMRDALHQVAKTTKTGAIIVTCGMRHVWEEVVEEAQLSDCVKVIGAGRIHSEVEADRFVVTPRVKAEVVNHLQKYHKCYVWAFGDSPVDINMLNQADRAVVIVGEERTRSKSMDKTLGIAIHDHGLRAQQILLPNKPLGGMTPRLKAERLPVTTLHNLFVNEISDARPGNLVLIHATNSNTSKILARDTRDSRISGPRLRETHRQIGWYLATHYLPDLTGLEQIQIPHVQGHQTTGHQLLHENRTLIVPLMRGGEPMALGVSDAFPRAGFVHAKEAEQIASKHVSGQSTIILVDGVVNTGASLVPFVQRIREFSRSIRIVVIAGVVQEEAVKDDGMLAGALKGHGVLTLVALRLSKNKFTGRGGTDTGHRLFNTVYLDE